MRGCAQRQGGGGNEGESDEVRPGPPLWASAVPKARMRRRQADPPVIWENQCDESQCECVSGQTQYSGTAGKSLGPWLSVRLPWCELPCGNRRLCVFPGHPGMVRKRGPCASLASGTASLCVELGESNSHPPCPQASPPPWAAARGCVALPWGPDAVRPPQTHILVGL